MHVLPHIDRGRAAERRFLAVCVLLFASSATLTLLWCTSPSMPHAMPMCGGGTASTMGMRMPGQTWPGAAVSFTGMWTVMMVAMMMPALMPMLLRYRRAIGGSDAARLDLLCLRVALAYFSVWLAIGAIVFAVGAAMTEAPMPAVARALPIASGIVVVIAGALQFSAWKARRLAGCRQHPSCGDRPSASATSAWRHGLHLGLRCSAGCANLTMVLLVAGVMDLRAMMFVTAAITAERLASDDVRIAKCTGAIVIAFGSVALLRAWS